MQYDSFKGLATLRSLAYPGYTFVYSVRAAMIDSCRALFCPCARGVSTTEVLLRVLHHRPK